MVILFYDCYRILSLVFKDGTYLREALSGVCIEESNRAKTTKICYGVLDKNITLDYYLENLCEKSPKSSIKILLKIAIYNIKYLNKKAYTVIDSTVELAKKLGKGGNAGFINAVLRKFVKTDFPLPCDEAEYLSVNYSYPLFAVNKLIADYGKSVALGVISSDEEYSFVRFPRGIDGEAYLTKKSVLFAKAPFSNLFSVQDMKLDDDFKNGVFTFQSVGSVAICDIVEGDKILDACAAPGGKSVLLAEKANTVTACEIHPHRVALIYSYIKRMCADNVNVVCCDSAVYKSEFCGQFDAVLCDVPCSGYGTLKNNPDIKLKTPDFAGLNAVQSAILSNCAKYVKPGGCLYYSTCSVFRDENDNVVKSFADSSTDFILEQPDSPLPHLKTAYGIQFLPDISLGAGFYISKMRRR